MAAKSKKRLSKLENKLLKLDKLQLNDLICSICQSILIEPVTLPCYHDFCQVCFNGSIENNALCCPLCRLRIGSWLRTATKQNNIVNSRLWDFIKSKFQNEIDVKLKGEDIDLPEDKLTLRLSAPGEIRSEYEAELKRLRAERVQIEQKHQKETELLVKKLQEEEEDAHKRYMDRLKHDEFLAKQLQKTNKSNSKITSNLKRPVETNAAFNSRLKTKPIENYFCKRALPVAAKDTPILTDDNTSTESTTPQAASMKLSSRASPEMVPSYTRYLKNFIDKKLKNVSGIWNKENGRSVSKLISSEIETTKQVEDQPSVKPKPNKTVHSLPVSLPYTGILLQHKKNRLDNRKETGSADSMRQELCYFKPIESTSQTSVKPGTGVPLRVPCKRSTTSSPLDAATAPSRDDYLNSLCRLRHLSLSQNLPSAFVIALNLLRANTLENPNRCLIRTKASLKKYTQSPVFPTTKKSTPIKNQHAAQVDGITKLNSKKTLRRTRSMGSLPKSVNETTTPKKTKIKDRKVSSERKHYLRSDSKKYNASLSLNSPPLIPEPINNDNINLGVKNLSSPLENCDVKKILEEQLRIERLIEQEQNDLELARKMDAELNRRPLRRSAVKRQVAINHALRPTKKLKV